MGNENSGCCGREVEGCLDKLCGLTERSYASSCQLGFDPFQVEDCFSLGFPSVSLERCQKGRRDFEWTDRERESDTMTGQPVSKDVSILLSLESPLNRVDLQKNKILNKKIGKSKQIKKPYRIVKTAASRGVDCDSLSIPSVAVEELSTQLTDEQIRDQNNCKSYHKLVKNYLTSKNLAYLFDEYGVEYHTRYYFVVALIFIKYCLKQDFRQEYRKIVKAELQVQRKKIARRQSDKERLLRELGQAKEGDRRFKELTLKIQKIESKISHIGVVIHEIQDFSVRSCEAFFSGNTDESLRILYMKDDPVMRKKYYFDSALEAVAEIQDKVREASSQST